MPVGRQDGLAIEIGQSRRPLPAAQEREIVVTPARDQGLGQLDRYGDHADALRPPAGGDVDREAGHERTLSKFGLPPDRRHPC
jgi:hypothetical protein